MDPAKARVVEYWTAERRAAAIPRDLRIDSRGLGYLRRPDGSLQPYGHQVSAEVAGNSPSPNAQPGGGGNDTIPPTIDNDSMSPADGAVIGASQKFSATVTDDVGVKSVTFTIQYPNGATQSFSANEGSDNVWSVTLSGFTDGNWSWWVTAKDTAKRGGNTATSNTVGFTVDTGGGGGGGGGGSGGNGDSVANATWAGGAVQSAAGRLYFEMPNNAKRKGPWTGFVCSGTTIMESAEHHSFILTAAHCVYDDVNKAFARNVLFIPNQAGTTGSGTDLDCDNDPMGCWAPSFGVVDRDWTTRVFPDNVAWDYAFYVVDGASLHYGPGGGTNASLEDVAGTLSIGFGLPVSDDGTAGKDSPDFTHALGYSYDDDPNFMYCADDMTTEGADNWWLAICGLSGGSSGGPWVQPMDETTGAGPVISVNSWGYVGSPGMAGPKLNDGTAQCLFDNAATATPGDSTTDGDAGAVLSCP